MKKILMSVITAAILFAGTSAFAVGGPYFRYAKATWKNTQGGLYTDEYTSAISTTCRSIETIMLPRYTQCNRFYVSSGLNNSYWKYQTYQRGEVYTSLATYLVSPHWTTRQYDNRWNDTNVYQSLKTTASQRQYRAYRNYGMDVNTLNNSEMSISYTKPGTSQYYATFIDFGP